jgi:DspF/AvrF protein.
MADTSFPQRLIRALAEHLQSNLQLQQGVCALFDTSGREAVVIEVPEHSDLALLHCAIDAAAPSDDFYRRLLEINFRMDLMGGSWFAVDDSGQVRLCAQSALSSLDEQRFCDWVVGFTAVAGELGKYLRAFTSVGAGRVSSRSLTPTRSL